MNGCAVNEQNEWKPADVPIKTQWAADVDPEKPLPEYPRPQMVRDSWLNLNGLWDYAVQGRENTRPAEFDGKILVPFPIESALSGVGKKISENERFWYRRTFTIPEDWPAQKILLHFEAVDWQAQVWINGQMAGEHRGGYDPFSFDITDYIKDNAEQELVVAVWDPTEKGTQPRGKQVSEPEGIWYTPVSGIWQTVWLESVPENHIKTFKIIPDVDTKKAHVKVNVSNALAGDISSAAVYDQNGTKILDASAMPGEELTLSMDDVHLWTPDDPYLYTMQIELVRNKKILDKVESYFGMRKVSLGKDEKGITRIMLNNEFVFQVGTLDQGFWPDGIYTAATDEALKYDIEMTKKLGFNMLRKHVKIENRRFYYWCDKLGILVWQDMPSGDKYIGPNDPDIQRSAESAKQFEYELTELVQTLYNHPSIIMWVPFNEGWGQYDTPRIVNLVKELDPSRLVNNTSGWADRGVGDIHDIHNYPDAASPQAEEKRAIVLGEFGGLGLRIDGHTWQKENWGYQQMTSSDDFILRYENIFNDVWELKDDPGLSAVVYTQITDVETETNGLLTYDRKMTKAAIDDIYKINTGDYARSPLISPKGGLFNKLEKISINTFGKEVFYTLDGSKPDRASSRYNGPFPLFNTCSVKAIAYKNDGTVSRLNTVQFELTDVPLPQYKFLYSGKYRAGGRYALLDKKLGTASFSDGAWQGFEGDDLHVTIDLGKMKKISSIEAGFLQDTNAWIFFPKEVIYEISTDGENYQQLYKRDILITDRELPPSIERFKTELDARDIRFVRLLAKNIETCPDWHKGAGGKSWIFADEIVIK